MSETNSENGPEESFHDFDADPLVITNNSSESSNVQEINPVIKGRKRSRNSTQAINKRLKDTGRSYKTYRGKGVEMEKKTPGPDCCCKLKCYEVVPEPVREEIFTKFWDYEDYNIQNIYLFGCLQKKTIQRKTKKRDTRRSGTIEYSIKFNNSNYKICKNAFISIHGVGRGRIENLVKKMKDGHNLLPIDQRGKHMSHKKVYNEQDLLSVCEVCYDTKVNIPATKKKIVGL